MGVYQRGQHGAVGAEGFDDYGAVHRSDTEHYEWIETGVWVSCLSGVPDVRERRCGSDGAMRGIDR